MDDVFQALKSILQKHADGLVVDIDEPGHYSLNEAKTDEKGRPIFFAMVKIGPKRVAFHLMPVYCHPELLDDVSPALRQRMQGKSCFNFTRSNPELFAELSDLVRRARKS